MFRLSQHPRQKGETMLFMALSELDIDWEPFYFWFNIAIWGLIIRFIIFPILKAFVIGLMQGSQQSTSAQQPTAQPSSGPSQTRQSRDGRHTNKQLPAPFRIKNAYVIDGDTLARGDWRIRIYGMDAPEADQAGGTEATEYMRTLVDGKTLHILPKDVDIYGRLVARVRTGQYDVGAEMVRSGHAVATVDFTRVYSGAERSAKKSRNGLWKQGAIGDPKAWREANK
jgi:endonuclease YncB( thermonuclease family)